MNAPELYEFRAVGILQHGSRDCPCGTSPVVKRYRLGRLDQAALQGVLMRILGLGVKLVSVNCIGLPEGTAVG